MDDAFKEYLKEKMKEKQMGERNDQELRIKEKYFSSRCAP